MYRGNVATRHTVPTRSRFDNEHVRAYYGRCNRSPAVPVARPHTWSTLLESVVNLQPTM